MEEVADFVIPLKYEDLEDENEDRYYVRNVIEVGVASTSIIQSCLSDVQTSIDEKAFAIHKHENFDTLYSLVKHFSDLQETVCINCMELLISGLSSLMRSMTMLLSEDENGDEGNFETALRIHRNALKMYVYLIQWGVSSLEKKESAQPETNNKKKSTSRKKKDTFGMDSWRQRTIKVLTTVLDHDLSRLWKAEKAEDAFILLFFNTAYAMLENPDNAKSKDTKASVFQLVTTALVVTDNIQGAVSAIVNMILKYEHMGEAVIELLESMTEENKSAENPTSNQFINEVFSEIGKMDNADLNMDKTGTTNLAKFIERLGEELPRYVLANMSVMITHLNDDSYTMRNAILHALSRILSKVLRDQSELVLKTRDDLLGILEERFRDTNAYTRSECIKCWSHLCEEKAIPMKMLPDLLENVKGRLYDKSAFVRKAAVQFLSSILEHNPYSNNLDKEKMEEGLKKAEEGLAVENISAAAQKKHTQNQIYWFEALRFIDKINSCIPAACQLLHSKTSTDVTECIEFLVRAYELNIRQAFVGIKQMMKLVWSREQAIKDAVLSACQHMFLKADKFSNPAVCIALARKFIDVALACNMQELVALEVIISLEVLNNSFPKALLLALWELYTVSEQVENPLTKDFTGAALILRMIANARPAHIRKRLKTLLKNGLGPRGELHAHYAMFTCQILEKLAIDDSSAGEAPKKSDDRVLDYIGGDSNYRLPADHPLFDRLIALICGQNYAAEQWHTFTEKALNCIFALCERPVAVAHKLIAILSSKTQTSESQDLETSSGHLDTTQAQPPTQTEPQTQTDGIHVSVTDLSKLFFVLGHSALKELVHVESQFKKAKKIKQMKQLEADQEKLEKETKKSKAKPKKRATKRRKKNNDSDEEIEDDASKNPTASAIEAELGLDPTQVEDHELDDTFEEKERMILSTDSIYMRFAPLILAVCTDHGVRFKDKHLRKHAILALCKFMTVNLDFCERNLQLLFTLLLSDKEDKVNMIIAIGDLACRFPNSVEPWTHHVYRCLRDTNRVVRKNTLMVLCHLVLNDMIKIKSNISEIVRLIEDHDEEIANLSKSFFTELARKGSGNNNPIYNLLPDVLSRLSAENVAQESFRNIMKFMLTFITKDRHTEKLVEKLCQRFKVVTIGEKSHDSTAIDQSQSSQASQASQPSQSSQPTVSSTETDYDTEIILRTNPITHWRDIAYCLTLLQFNEKCVKKLVECLKDYQHALADEEVYTTIKTLGTKKITAKSEKGAAKAQSGEFKQAIDDWEKKIAELHAKLSEEFHYENHVLEQATSRRKARKTKQTSKPEPKKRGRGRKRKIEEEEEEEEEEEVVFDSEDEDKKRKPKKRTTRGRKKKVEDEEEEEQEQEEPEETQEAMDEAAEEEPATVVVSRRTRRNRRTRKGQ